MTTWFAAKLAAGFGLLLIAFYLGGLRASAEESKLAATAAGALAKSYADLDVVRLRKEAAYEKEIDSLKNSQLEYPSVAVRLCPSNPQLPAARGAGQVLPPRPGILQAAPVPDREAPDVGPALFADADFADQIVAKCRND